MFKRQTIFFQSSVENVESFMGVKMMILVLWIENVFNHGSDVCHIVYGIWGGYRRALPFSPFIFMCCGAYLVDDEDISILVELA